MAADLASKLQLSPDHVYAMIVLKRTIIYCFNLKVYLVVVFFKKREIIHIFYIHQAFSVTIFFNGVKKQTNLGLHQFNLQFKTKMV